jgi:hypothetical protein
MEGVWNDASARRAPTRGTPIPIGSTPNVRGFRVRAVRLALMANNWLLHARFSDEIIAVFGCVDSNSEPEWPTTGGNESTNAENAA